MSIVLLMYMHLDLSRAPGASDVASWAISSDWHEGAVALLGSGRSVVQRRRTALGEYRSPRTECSLKGYLLRILIGRRVVS